MLCIASYSAEGGTFVSDTSGTFIPILSSIGHHYLKTKRAKNNRYVAKNNKRPGKEPFFSEAFGCCCQYLSPGRGTPVH